MNPNTTLLNPNEIALCVIDQEPQMFFAVEGIGRQTIMNAVVGLAKTASIFNVPTILSTVEAKQFSGNLYSKITDVFPQQMPIDRTTLNAWEDQNFKTALEATGRKKILFSGLWTEVCVTLPALSALAEGYEVYVVADACAGSSKVAHEMAMQRMIQAGAIPVTWQAVLLELQRDWARKDTYNQVMKIIQSHGGAYGLGVEYANTMIPKQPS